MIIPFLEFIYFFSKGNINQPSVRNILCSSITINKTGLVDISGLEMRLNRGTSCTAGDDGMSQV